MYHDMSSDGGYWVGVEAGLRAAATELEDEYERQDAAYGERYDNDNSYGVILAQRALERLINND